MGGGRGVSDDILKTAMTSLKYDRPKTQTFMLGILKLLILGINNELAFRQFKYGKTNVLMEIQKWKVRLPSVQNRMKQINSEIMKHFHSQAEEDIAEFRKSICLLHFLT